LGFFGSFSAFVGSLGPLVCGVSFLFAVLGLFFVRPVSFRVVVPGFWSVWVCDCRSVGGRVSSALSLVDKRGWLTLVGVFTGRSGLQSA